MTGCMGKLLQLHGQFRVHGRIFFWRNVSLFIIRYRYSLGFERYLNYYFLKREYVYLNGHERILKRMKEISYMYRTRIT